MLLDFRDVTDSKTIQEIDQHQQDEEDVDDKDDPSNMRREFNVFKLEFSSETHDNSLHKGFAACEEVGIDIFLSLDCLGTVENDKETEAEWDDEDDVQGERPDKVPADFSKHLDVGGEGGMFSNQQDKLSPAEQDDDSRNVLDHMIFSFVEEQDEGEDNHDDLKDVLQVEDVSAEWYQHLEELSCRDDAKEDNCEGCQNNIVPLWLRRRFFGFRCILNTQFELFGVVDILIDKENIGGEKDEEGKIEAKVGVKHWSDSSPLQAEEGSYGGMIQEIPVFLNLGHVPKWFCFWKLNCWFLISQ